MHTFDVLAVNLTTRKVRLMAQDKNERDAEAIVEMAVIRRGVEEEFYTTVPAGKYAEGDKYSSR